MALPSHRRPKPKKRPRLRIPRVLFARLMLEVRGRCAIPGCPWTGPLQVHHINGDRGDNRFANLIAICASHHDEAERTSKWTPTFFRELKIALGATPMGEEGRILAASLSTSVHGTAGLALEAIRQSARSLSPLARNALDDARSQIEAGDFAKARLRLDSLLRSVKRSPFLMKRFGAHVRNALGVCAYRLGQSALAERHYRAGLEIQVSWKILRNLAALLLVDGRPAEALVFARRAAHSRPREVSLALVLGLAEWETGTDLDRVVRRLEAARRDAPSDAGLSLHLARFLGLKGDYTRSAECANAAARAAGPAATSQLIAGAALQLAFIAEQSATHEISGGRLIVSSSSTGPSPKFSSPVLDRAILHFQSALDGYRADPLFLKRDLGSLYLNLGMCFDLRGDSRQAMRNFLKARAFRERALDACIGLLQALMNMDRFALVLRLTESMESRRALPIEAQRTRGLAFLRTGDARSALPYLRAVAASPAAGPEDKFNFVTALALEGAPEEYEKALADLRASGKVGGLARNLAMAHVQQGECGLARPFLEEALGEEPADLDLREHLARIACHLEGADAASRVLAESEATYLERGGSLAWAVVHLLRHQPERARQHLERLVKGPCTVAQRDEARRILRAIAAGVTDIPVSFGYRIPTVRDPEARILRNPSD